MASSVAFLAISVLEWGTQGRDLEIYLGLNSSSASFELCEAGWTLQPFGVSILFIYTMGPVVLNLAEYLWRSQCNTLCRPPNIVPCVE